MREQEQRLKRWASGNNREWTLERWHALELLSNSTAEHEIRMSDDGQRVFKRNLPGTWGMIPQQQDHRWSVNFAKPDEYFRRMRLTNWVFHDDIRLEGIITSFGDSFLLSAVPGQELVTAVISQPFYPAADPDNPHPSREEIAQRMRQEGFVPVLGFLAWRRSDGVVVVDAKRENFIRTPEGVVPIDLPIFAPRQAMVPRVDLYELRR